MGIDKLHVLLHLYKVCLILQIKVLNLPCKLFVSYLTKYFGSLHARIMHVNYQTCLMHPEKYSPPTMYINAAMQ